ncbi:MAG: metallophosphoesterase [Spirochaetota bacterium]
MTKIKKGRSLSLISIVKHLWFCLWSGLLLLAAFSCTGIRFIYKSDRDVTALIADYTPAFPIAEFAVISDPHFYSASLGVEGPLFAKYLSEDRKLLVESEEIFIQAIETIRKLSPRFVIIPGDLTKDGEKINHEKVASYLSGLKAEGINVFVIPGNHDILNPHAFRFTSEGGERVPNVSPEEFRVIYRDFGYGDALLNDPSSLSYAAEPIPGLWLLALDSCDYRKNMKRGEPETDGRFTKQQVKWIEQILMEAVKKKKAVIAMMHHGLLEHYPTQEKHYGQYIIDNYKELSQMFARYKVRTVFTGHYHAQDITVESFDPAEKQSEFIFDIETGSLVTDPCPVRQVILTPDNEMIIQTHNIREIPSFKKAGKNFQAYTWEFTHNGIAGIAIDTMKKLGIKEKEAHHLAPQIADAFLAHYAGDEKFTGSEMITTRGLSLMGSIVVAFRKDLVFGLWTDLEPVDNNIRIDLSSGKWKK